MSTTHNKAVLGAAVIAGVVLGVGGTSAPAHAETVTTVQAPAQGSSPAASAIDLVAATVNVYDVPLTNPVTCALEAPAATVTVLARLVPR